MRWRARERTVEREERHAVLFAECAQTLARIAAGHHRELCAVPPGKGVHLIDPCLGAPPGVFAEARCVSARLADEGELGGLAAELVGARMVGDLLGEPVA